MSVGVFTPDLRIRWIMLTTSELGDVGDGTDHPIEVAFDQIAEIYYRVEDCWFTGGSISIATGNPLEEPAFSASLTAPTSATIKRTSHYGSISRGYTTRVEVGPAVVSAHNSAYLDAEYDAGGGIMCRDITNDERGMWLRGDPLTTLPFWDFESGSPNTTNSFSCSFDGGGSVGYPYAFAVSSFFDLNPPTYVSDAEAFVRFSGSVVVIREDSSHGICAATNRYFIGVEFFVRDGSGGFGIFEASTNESLLSGAGAKVLRSGEISEYVQYTIRLASGDVSCPVFLYYGDETTYPYQYGEDFIHEAQKWWPYAKSSPAEPVWDSTDGTKLP
jgi:hypothetical protein